MDDDAPRTLVEHLRQAEMMYDLDRLPEARAEVDAALRIDPLDADANTMAAVVALAELDPDQALVYAGAALARNPQHHRAMITRGYALADADRREEALQAAASLLDLDRTSWLYHIHYALITRRAGAGQPALDAAWNAVNLAPEQPRTHLTLAAVAESLDLDDLARRSRRPAADLDPETAGPQAQRLPPEARRRQRAFVDADPDDPDWRSKIYGPGLFRGALGRSILLGVSVVFAIPALLGSGLGTGTRLCFGVIAAACWVAWFTVLRRHRDPE